MIKKIFLFFTSLVLSLSLAEFVLRIFMPGLGSEVFKLNNPGESPFIYNEQIGYEPKPFALLETKDDLGSICFEKVNSEGFRAPEYTIPKPEEVLRILAVGDSVVQAFSVAYKRTWEQVLQDRINQRFASLGLNKKCEVINTGVGGYVSWQALQRLGNRGLKYQPDLVLVLVGANDLLFSSLPYWGPKINLSDIEQAYLKPVANAGSSTFWSIIRLSVYRYSYFARLVRQARNNIWNNSRIHNLIKEHQKNNGLEFNKSALDLYIHNLEKIYNTTKENGVRMGLVIWPVLPSAELINDPDINWRLRDIYSNFPLSNLQLWDWYIRYLDAQRQFALRHLDIISIDAAAAFEDKDKKQRLRLFVDMCHLTVEGNRLLAEVILNKLIKKGMFK